MKVVIFLLSCGVCWILAADHTVKTNVGDITGSIKTISFDGKSTTIGEYLGIPFAKPPVGNLRFKKPLPAYMLTKPFVAKKYGLPCPQYTSESMIYTTPAKTSEDCLSLNIHTPRIRGTGKVPVMIFIFGGAFIHGQSSMHDPHNLVAYGDILVVTFNYRLGPFGFLSTGDDQAPGNAGLWDQQLAIKWVNNNIDRFGGDKTKITLFGESAGSSSVFFQTLYSGNKNMFQGAIAESGSSTVSWAMTKPSDAYMFAKELAVKLNCKIPMSNASKKILTCLRAVQNATEIAVMSEAIRWTPTMDNAFVTAQTVASLKWPPSGKTNYQEFNMIIGSNGYDGHYFLSELYRKTLSQMTNGSISNLRMVFSGFIENMLKPMITDQTTRQHVVDAVMFAYSNAENPNDKNFNIKQVSDFITDSLFFIPAVEDVIRHSYMNTKTSTYQYEFNHKYPLNVPGNEWLQGATHGGELPYVFGFPPTLYGYTPKIAKDELPMSKIVMDYWTNFAKTGNPNKPKAVVTTWKPYGNDKQDYLYFPMKDQPITKQHLNARRAAFWMKYFPILLKQETEATKPKITPKLCTSSSSNTLTVGYLFQIGFIATLFLKV